MSDPTFFDEQTGQSEAKARIVQKYLWAWANVILSQKNVKKIAYIDLFSGPGRYENGASSTPLLVLEKAVKDIKLCQKLITIFNDRDEEATSKLKQEIDNLEGIEKLKYKPQIKTSEVGVEIVKIFESMQFIPTLFFVDPWGYKGLSLKLINSVLKDWGCDCIFFFNYNRINMGITNPSIETHMKAIFSEKRLEEMVSEISKYNPEERELFVIEKLCEALKEQNRKELFVLPFRFRKRDYRTSHHLIFASKHFKGYDIMKGIMAKESSDQIDDVPSFEYSPSGNKFPILYELSKPLDELKQMLLDDYAGKSISVKKIYENHSIGTPFLMKNYKDVIKSMENNGEVVVIDPEKKKRRKGTLADKLIIKFRTYGDNHG